jgi:hypothetical protein
VKTFELIKKSRNLERFYFSVWREKLEATAAMETNEDNGEKQVEIVTEVQEAQQALTSLCLKQEPIEESKAFFKNTKTQPLTKAVIGKVEELKQSSTKTTRSFACIKCPKKFSTETGLRFHIKFHDFPRNTNDSGRAPTSFGLESVSCKIETDQDLDDKTKPTGKFNEVFITLSFLMSVHSQNIKSKRQKLLLC